MKINNNINCIRPSRGCLVYTLQTDSGIVVVDTGSNGRDADFIAGFVEKKLGSSASSINYIFLTHWHGDHAGGAQRLKQLSGAKILCHQADSPLLSGSNAVDTFMEVRMPEQGYGLFNKTLSVLGYGFMKADTAPFLPDEEFDEAPTPFDEEWQMIHLPGHTPGSAGLWSPVQRILFSGDVVLCIGRKVVPPIPMLINNFSSLKASWEKVSSLGEIKWVLPGHFNPQSVERKLNVSKWLIRKAAVKGGT
ncbi:MAG: MBL fold metallo-hydrolase [Candidatus Saccharibacteria bacterium]